LSSRAQSALSSFGAPPSCKGLQAWGNPQLVPESNVALKGGKGALNFEEKFSQGAALKRKLQKKVLQMTCLGRRDDQVNPTLVRARTLAGEPKVSAKVGDPLRQISPIEHWKIEFQFQMSHRAVLGLCGLWQKQGPQNS